MPQTEIRREALSIKEFATILGVCDMTVRRWIQRKYVIANRVGPFLIRIPVSEIRRMRTLRAHFDDNAMTPKYPEV